MAFKQVPRCRYIYIYIVVSGSISTLKTRYASCSHVLIFRHGWEICREKGDVLAGWIVGAISAAAAVRWITFPETFWCGSPSVDEYNLSPEALSSGSALVADATCDSDAYSGSNVEAG